MLWAWLSAWEIHPGMETGKKRMVPGTATVGETCVLTWQGNRISIHSLIQQIFVCRPCLQVLDKQHGAGHNRQSLYSRGEDGKHRCQ